MHARTSSWTGTAEALDKWVKAAASVGSMVAGLPGNAGAWFFVDREAGRALTLTLWDSEDAALATDTTAEQSRAATVAATGVEMTERSRYEVVATAGGPAANKEVSRRFTELFCAASQVRADDVFSADFVFHGAAGDGEIHGIGQFNEFLAAYHRAFPDAHSTVEAQVAEQDIVVTRWRARGTHDGDMGPIPATGRSFEMGGVTIERFAGGKIAEVWAVRDEVALLHQLGVLPDPAVTST